MTNDDNLTAGHFLANLTNADWKPVQWIDGPRKGKLLIDEQSYGYEKKKTLTNSMENWRCVESRNAMQRCCSYAIVNQRDQMFKVHGTNS